MSSREMNRRAVLAGAAAIAPAAAVAAVPASPPLGDVSFPDLASRLARIYPRWRDRTNADSARLQRFEARLKAATGLSREEAPAHDEPGREEYNAILGRLIGEPDPLDPPDPVNEHGESIALAEINDELWPLIDAIMDEPARTLADLAVQARAIAVMHDDFWTSDVLSPDEYNLRAFVSGICSLAGIEPLPGLDAFVDLPVRSDASDDGEIDEAEGAAS